MVERRRRDGAVLVRATGDVRVVTRRPVHKASRVGSTLVGLGFLTVLGVAFFVGVVAGRHFPGLLPSLGGTAVAKEPRRGIDRLADRMRPMEPAPVLTFYEELTAPLTPAPLAAKPKPSRGKLDVARPDALMAEPSKPPAPAEKTREEKTGEPDGTTRSPATAPAERAGLAIPVTTTGAPRYTVQVGAFQLREQAEAIRARLTTAGHDAFVVDFDSPASTRYRVRVGSYASRDEARLAAERLTATQRLPTYVTVR